MSTTKESYYQAKIMKAIEGLGGVAINGRYTKSGEADLQCGIPKGDVLLYIAIEVKTPADYTRVMSAIDTDYNITNPQKLKVHETRQIAKIRRVRRLGGKALVACDMKQVAAYLMDN